MADETIYLVLERGWNEILLAYFSSLEEAKEYAKEYDGIIAKLISPKKELDIFVEQ